MVERLDVVGDLREDGSVADHHVHHANGGCSPVVAGPEPVRDARRAASPTVTAQQTDAAAPHDPVARTGHVPGLVEENGFVKSGEARVGAGQRAVHIRSADFAARRNGVVLYAPP